MNAGVKARKRVVLFFFLIVAGMIIVGVRIAYLQFIQGPQLAAKTQKQLEDHRPLQSLRGAIYDRNGRELAISIVTKSLYANPRQLSLGKTIDAPTLAGLLAPILDMPASELTERLTVKGSFMWLKRTMEPDKVAAVEQIIHTYKVRGLEFIDEGKRYYPNDMLAAHVLGFVGTDDIGLEGIESRVDRVIKGEKSKQILATDGKGNPIFHSIMTYKPSKEGKSVHLTIDSKIQFIVEQSLDGVMARTQAKGVTAIVMNPRTGEILAMASRPVYNPNEFEKYGPAAHRNRAISHIFEPGSTFKAITAAAALQERKATGDERFVDQGYIEVSGRRIKNWDGESRGNISFVDVIKNSINTCFIEVGLRVGGEKMTDYARRFGFGQATDIELPGEEEGILFNPKSMRDVDVATMSIGHGVAVTPLQMVTAFAAIANDGVLVKPHIIKEIQNADGTIFSASPTTPVRPVIETEIAKNLTVMLEKVISEGGGSKGAVPGYRLAGKTGTAEKLKDTGGYQDGHYIASFVGFGPVEDPQLVTLVMIDDPVGMYYGGVIAAPVFHEIMSQSLLQLGLKPNPTLVQPKPVQP